MDAPIFEVFAKLTLDSQEHDQKLDEEGGKLEAFGKKVLETLGTVGKAVGTATVAAVGAAATAVVNMTKQAVESYAEYEQLIGGVETLFKESASTVEDNAVRAYKTAGISANEYMQTVTSFSASLIQSTGRGAQEDLVALKKSLEEQYTEEKRHWEDRIALVTDSAQKTSLKRQMEDELKVLKEHNAEVLAQAEASNMMSVSTTESLEKAAKLADMAIVDMSDNANKMGTSMESIQNAYQGFSKQNYTMLDNLKLGYGGTRAEMERLLADAERFSGIKYDISSYADVVQAIHVVQQEMEISGRTAEECAEIYKRTGRVVEEQLGTTAKEAATTLEGSLKMLKASWADMLTSIAGGGESTKVAIDNLITSAEAFITNVVPVVQEALYGIGDLIAGVAPIIAEKLPELIEELVPMLLDTAITIVDSLVENLPMLVESIGNALMDIIPDLVQAAVDLLDSLLSDILPVLFELAVSLVLALGEGIAENVDKLIDSVVSLVLFITETIVKNLPKLIEIGLKIILAVIMGILQNIEKIGTAIGEMIPMIVETILASLPEIIKLGGELILALTIGILAAIPRLLISIGEGLGLIKKTIKEETTRMDDDVRDSNAKIQNRLSSLERDLGVSKDGLRETTGQMVTITKDSVSEAQKYADKIESVSNVTKKQVETILNGLGPIFNQTLGVVNTFVDEFNKAIDKTLKKLDELNNVQIKPYVDPSGVIDGCDAIVRACERAIDALRNLNGSSGGGGFGGGRASGGWVQSGSTYLVGEEGPELITVSRDMYVHNARETASMLNGGEKSIVININGDVYDDQYSMRRNIRGAVLSVLQEQMSYG